LRARDKLRIKVEIHNLPRHRRRGQPEVLQNRRRGAVDRGTNDPPELNTIGRI
jgi:hypothetical protein